MAVVKRGQHGPRRAPPPDKEPRTLIGLIWGLTGDRERAHVLIETFAGIVLVCCVPACICIDTIALVAHGTKGLTLATLLPSGLTGSGWLTYLIIRIRKRVKSRRRDAATGGRSTT
jgi:hypothetical protein